MCPGGRYGSGAAWKGQLRDGNGTCGGGAGRPWGGRVSSELAGADLQADLHRVSQVDQLAARVAACVVRGEEVLAGFRDIQLLQWESPAGRAYRDTVALQAAALRRSLESLMEAKAAVERHSRETLVADCSYGGRF